MSQKIPVISGSARENGDTQRLVDMLLKDVSHEQILLNALYVAPYNYNHVYPQNDMFPQIVDAVLQSEKVIFATPVYWYAMSGLMKTFFDRITDLVTIEKKTGRKLSGKRVYLVTIGSDPELPTGFEVPFCLTADYLDMRYVGSVYCPEIQLANQDWIVELKDKFEQMLFA